MKLRSVKPTFTLNELVNLEWQFILRSTKSFRRESSKAQSTHVRTDTLLTILSPANRF